MPAQPVVVDANILISLIIAKGSKQRLFFSSHLIPHSPEFVLFEIGKYWSRVSEASGLLEEDLKQACSEVREQLKTVPLSEIKKELEEATTFSPDPDDIEYFALALKLNCPIWSEDKELKKQSAVEVLTTPELLVRLGVK
jgi:predicted nucleic acid-binding protein